MTLAILDPKFGKPISVTKLSFCCLHSLISASLFYYYQAVTKINNQCSNKGEPQLAAAHAATMQPETFPRTRSANSDLLARAYGLERSVYCICCQSQQAEVFVLCFYTSILQVPVS